MATTTNFGWETPDDSDLVKDGALAMRTLGNAIDTTTKNLNPETTLGDLAYRSSTSNTNTRLAIGTTGQVLTVSGGVPVWGTPASGGSALVNKTTFSASSGFNVDSVFSSSYDNYQLVLSYTGSAAANLFLQFRTSGSTNTNSNYTTQFLRADNTTVEASRLGSQTSIYVGRNNTVRQMVFCNIQNPFNSLQTGTQAFIQNNLEGLCEMRMNWGNFSSTTSFDGYRVSPESGTITGTAYLYGLAN